MDTIIRELETSSAGSSRLGSETLPLASFGGDTFSEAADLARVYAHVHQRLTDLSKTFGDQVEAMGIAVQGIDRGFDNLEDDLKRRFWKIYGRQENPEQRQKTEGGEEAVL
ncbi:hypothetical protein E0L36_13530 [Streptomyces sp. AJS327]|uniref:hypothetical protein n=1 Tax=Streptomyces sp. AJS327 TaxID=2545265 RepID=UPI0015DEAEF8|nr:hypothetical protein [Streptomyces sp. AJS327]MBA0051881.1 hypothetical protein [Streptomyces sp. AJS327]